jgi:hypothetical protein
MSIKVTNTLWLEECLEKKQLALGKSMESYGFMFNDMHFYIYDSDGTGSSGFEELRTKVQRQNG